MKKLLVVCLSLMFVFVLVPADSSAEDFRVMWNMEVPRSTYFIGETISLTVTAFASTDPDLRLPGEMAQITIRNQSMVEVFQSWVTTNANGSAPVSWDIDLMADTGNYTIILAPINGEKSTKSINVLYNEETYWKERVDQLQDEINKNYEYLNYLFVFNNYLTKQVKWVKQTITIMWVMVFLCLIVGVYCGMYLAANQPSTAKGVLAAPGKLLNLMGISSESPLYLQHEEVAQLEVPANKVPPIYGHDFICKICQKKGLPLLRMTRSQFEEHMWAHDRVALKRASLSAKWKSWKANREAVKNEPKPEVKPSFGTIEKYAEEEMRADKKTELKQRLKRLKKLQKKSLVSTEVFNKQLAQIKAEKEKLSSGNSKPVYKQTTSPKPELQRKVRMEKHISRPTEKPVEKTAPQLKIPNSKTAIDELFDKLNNEKVN